MPSYKDVAARVRQVYGSDGSLDNASDIDLAKRMEQTGHFKPGEISYQGIGYQGPPDLPIQEAPEAKAINALASGYGTAQLAGLGASAIGGLGKLSGLLKTAPGAMEVGSLGAGQVANEATHFAAKGEALNKVFGGPENEMAIGTKLQKLAESASQKARTVAGQPFEDLKSMAQDLPIAPQRPEGLASAVQEGKVTLDQLPPSLRKGKLASFINDESNLNPIKQPTFQLEKGLPIFNAHNIAANEAAQTASQRSLPELLAIRQELSKVAQTGNKALQTNAPGMAGKVSNQGRIAYDLVDTIDQDLSKMTANTPFMDKFQAARQGWQNFKNTYNSDAMNSLANADPSKAGAMLRKTPEAINQISSALGNEGIGLLRKSALNEFSANPSQIPAKLAANPDITQTLFEPQHIGALNEFSQAHGLLQGMPSGGPVTTPLDTISKVGGGLGDIGKELVKDYTINGPLKPIVKAGKSLGKVMSDTRGSIFPTNALSEGPMALPGSELRFKGIQEVPGAESMPLFDVLKKGHPLEGSTITGETAIKHGLQPKFEDVTDMVKRLKSLGSSDEDIGNAIKNTQMMQSSLRPEFRQPGFSTPWSTKDAAGNPLQVKPFSLPPGFLAHDPLKDIGDNALQRLLSGL